MPELPEVETTVRGLKQKVVGHTIKDVWSDLPRKTVSLPHFANTIKSQKFFDVFKKRVCGKKIVKITRRAKNILIELSSGDTILVHMKMTGHLLFGEYTKEQAKGERREDGATWTPSKNEKNDALRDPFNRFVHFVLVLDHGKHLVLSDTRKFAKVTLISAKDLENEFAHLGPEPLEKKFVFTNFKSQMMTRKSGKVKQVLLDQTVISGIGNIYSDEMLWLAGIHPEEKVADIPSSKMKLLFAGMKEVLAKGIDFGGDSMSDYRDINGKKGNFQHHHNAYRRKGEACGKRGCKGVILRKVVAGRSSHYCSIHQKLSK
jgi:formamidopyrimidine-DNA glycosylase